MKISTRGRYALRMMIDIAEHNAEGRVTVKDISKRQGISIKYLEQIVTVLKRTGLLHSERGSGGGYRLVKPPEQYSVGEILRSIEGNLAPVQCLDGEVNLCERKDYCKTLDFWTGLYNTVNKYVDAVTLRELM